MAMPEPGAVTVPVRLVYLVRDFPPRNETDQPFSVWLVETRDGARFTAAVRGLVGDEWGEPGDPVTLSGRWRVPGEQFDVDGLWPDAPPGTQGLIRWLSGQPQIGEATALRVAQALGPDAMSRLADDPSLLDAVPDLPPYRREALARAVRRYADSRGEADVRMWCHKHGLGPAQAAAVWKHFGVDAIRQLTADPWSLSALDGFGFVTADELAMRLGVNPASEPRIRAAVRHVLQQAADEGHVYLPRTDAVSRTVELLAEIARHSGYSAGDRLAVAGAAAAAADALVRERGLVADGDRLYLPHLWRAERMVREWLAARQGAPGMLNPEEAGALVASLVARMPDGQRLDGVQSAAVATALSHGASALTGGPGTGKTTCIRTLLDAILTARPQAKVLMAAPTGRAARRMAEVTGHVASTIHRLLEFGPLGKDSAGRALWGFRRNATCPLDGDFLIVDESSMIDLPLMAALMSAVPPSMPVLLVGDADQLPPVGPGAPYHAITGKGLLPVSRLERIYRQGAGSPIPVAARAVKRGEMPSEVPGDRTFRMLIHPRPPKGLSKAAREAVARKVRQGMADDVLAAVGALMRKYGFHPDEIQVLTPIRRGPCGTAELNARLRELLNPDGAAQGIFVTSGGKEFRVGDRVMQLVNNYDRYVFNGEQGTVVLTDALVDDETGEPLTNPDGSLMRDDGDGPLPDGTRRGFVVAYPDGDGQRLVAYTSRDAGQLDLAYAVTVHKAQGSEYPAVVLVLGWDGYLLLERQLLYTAITRAARHLILISEAGAVEQAVRTVDGSVRFQDLG